MNVLMTADAVGGVWSYALALAGALAPRDVRVTLAVMGPPPDAAQRAAAGVVPGLQLLERPYRLEWMDDPWTDVAHAGEWLLSLEHEMRPDVVHLNGYAHAALPWRAPTVVVAHSCVLSWWAAVHGVPAPASWNTYRSAVARGVQAADVVVAPTRAMLDAIERHYGAVGAAGIVVPNAAHSTFAAHVAPRAQEPFVLSAGRVWDEAKNIATLDSVAARVAWPVYVAGDARHPDGGTVALLTARPLGSLTPPVLARWMRRASIYALPARYEPFGLSALEAGLAGCALVLGDIPSLREVWGEAATYVAPDDVGALGSAVNALIADEPRRAAFGERARRRAHEYTPERMAGGYAAVYERLAGLPAAARPSLQTCS